jgi:putative membrane protein
MDAISEALSFLDYDWVRAIHIVFVIAWMAGLLIYPRLLVYRLEAEGDARFEAAMDAAASKTKKIILTPAIIIVWLLGLILLFQRPEYLLGQPWMHMKLTLVLILSGFQGWLTATGRKIAAGQKPVPAKTLRMMNEIPMLIAIVAVIMVVVQPFAR